MKGFVIGDVHETTFWKQYEPEFVKVDRVYFVGDYFDFHGDKPEGDAIQNFNNICELKKNNPEKFTLLFGNHDYHYVGPERYSNWQIHYAKDYKKAIFDNIELLDISSTFGNYVVSHAGFSRTYLNGIRELFGLSNDEDALKKLNEELHNKNFNLFRFYRYDYSDYGDDVHQSPLWIRPDALSSDPAFGKQIVGHTPNKNPVMYDKDGIKILYVDTFNHDGGIELELE